VSDDELEFEDADIPEAFDVPALAVPAEPFDYPLPAGREPGAWPEGEGIDTMRPPLEPGEV
jgi:hypothetical protein